jgi:uncharacterized NAD(P)/FAD-binding protein YdhS
VIRFGTSGGDGSTRIAVVGGGAAGAAVVGEFLRRRSAACELVWLTGRSAPGRGVAYATNNAMHLLNVRAANMGLFADDAGALLRFLEARCTPALPGDFLPRAAFGDYVEATLAQLMASGGVRLELLACEAIAIERAAAGGYIVGTDQGARIAVDGVVLAIGALPPVPIAEVDDEAIASGRYLPDPWQAPSLERAPQEVAVLGSGLTAVDVILSAATTWPDARIIALSRHGRLPAAHGAAPAKPYPHQEQLIEELRAAPSARRWVRMVRECLHDDAPDWRSVIDGLRPATVELWRSLDVTQRRRFLRHVRWIWEAARHRMPPPTAQIIERLQDEGRLRVVAGRVRRIEGSAPLAMTYRRRDDGTTRLVSVDLAIQATGLQTAVQRTSHRLLRQMFETRLLRADRQGLGIDADTAGRVMRVDGTAEAGLRVIGTLLRGTLWECTALPEIRAMAAKLARELPFELGHSRKPGSSAYAHSGDRTHIDMTIRQFGA